MFNLGVSRPDRDLPDRPTHLISTWFQLEPTLPSVNFGFPCPRPNASGSSGRFSSPKPEPPDLTEVIYKSGEIKLKSEEIQQVLNHIWWDLARSSHSQQILAVLVQILANLMQIWWVFTFFGDDLVDSGAVFFFFFTNIDDFYSSSDEPKPTKQTRSPIQPKTNLTNWHQRSVSGHSFFHLTPAGRVWAGSKIDLTRPMDSPSSIHDISIDVWVLSCFQ